MNRSLWLGRLDQSYAAFRESYAGLTDAEMTEPGVTGEWSVRDIIAHVTWWEEEALTHLPLILRGGRPPRYSDAYGGIDAFNAQRTEQRSTLSLAETLQQQAQTHQRLVEYLQGVPEQEYSRETRFRRRLCLDTFGHYPLHAEAIRQWRADRSGAPGQAAG